MGKNFRANTPSALLRGSPKITDFQNLFKTALIDVLETRRDLVRDIFEEAMEDVAFTRAIEQGMKSEMVSRDEVFAILDGNQ